MKRPLAYITAAWSGEHEKNGQQAAAGIYMAAGRVSHTIIRNCESVNVRNYGAGIYADGGLIDNCLITGCKTFHHRTPNGNAAVCLMGTSTMVNCTVAKNTSCIVTGIWVGSANARAINCISFGNGFCGKESEHNTDWRMEYSGCFASGVFGQSWGVGADFPLNSETPARSHCGHGRGRKVFEICPLTLRYVY